MLDLQVARLIATFPQQFSKEDAARAVARAYGYRKLNLVTMELSDPVPGLQAIKPYSQILKLDPTHQLIEFMRMALNLSLPSDDDTRKGVPERMIIAAMMNFSNFDALINYARSDPVDPNTTDRAMLAKFQQRFGYYAPIQYVLGRYIHDHCLIIQPDDDKAQRIIDQEVALNPLDNTKVVILRNDPNGADWLKVMTHNLGTYSGPLDENYAVNAGKAATGLNVLVSTLPHETYSLSMIVKSHIELLEQNSPDGRALIIDRVPVSMDADDLDKAFTLAGESQVHVVVIVKEPNAELWKRTGIHLIFGFPENVQESYLEMDKYIGYSAPYVGFKRGKMQYLYQSQISGPRFGAMDLIPDDPKTKSLLQRMKEAIRG